MGILSSLSSINISKNPGTSTQVVTACLPLVFTTFRRLVCRESFVKLLGIACGIFMFPKRLCSEMSFPEYGERSSF